jgi:2-succinyl-6-hydroxy-2,4-cyclohexadiene-1-carboxylate synthase
MPTSTPTTSQPPPAESVPAPTTGLHAEFRGTGPRLVMAHGFTQTGRAWGTLHLDLASDHQVVLVDLPGHGDSSHVGAGLAEGGLLVGELGGRAGYLGYSMGARFCLHLALARPDLVERLVLISGTAGIDEEEGRRQRRAADEALADDLDPPLGSARPAVPVASFVHHWLDRPMFAGIPPEADGLDERLRNTGPGLASSLRRAGTGTQRPLWEVVGGLSMPVLIITGERDEKFTALGTRLAEAIGSNATREVVAGCGHAPHLQRPTEVAGLVRRHEGRATRG